MENPDLSGSEKPKIRFLKYCHTLKNSDLLLTFNIVNWHYHQSYTCATWSQTYDTPTSSLKLIDSNFIYASCRKLLVLCKKASKATPKTFILIWNFDKFFENYLKIWFSSGTIPSMCRFIMISIQRLKKKEQFFSCGLLIKV